MLGLWLNDMESLEAICQDDEAKRIFLRMAAMSRDGNMGNFLSELARDEDLDDEIKEWDAVRVPPGMWRGYEAGPEGLEILVIGAPNLGEDPREDVDGQRDWWAD